MKKIMIILGLICSIITVPVSANQTEIEQLDETSEYQTKTVQTRTQEQIRAKAKTLNLRIENPTTYKETPNVKYPYKAGAVSDNSIKEALDMVNMYRYIAGLPADIELNNQYNTYAQYGAVLMNASEYSHTPFKPANMSEDFYSTGYKGTSSSNIGYGYKSISDSIIAYMSDSSVSNISRVGHRRWLLSPTMKYIGFGMAGNMTASYVFDNSRTLSYDHITWPAEQTPIELFKDMYSEKAETPFSVSLNPAYYDMPSLQNINVSVKNKKTGKTIQINQNTVNNTIQLYISSSNYGRASAIIFYFGACQAGDQYEVTITGLRKNGNPASLTYQTNFFNLNLDETENPNNFNFVKSNNKITITGYKGLGGKVKVPSKINELPVTTISETAFQSNSKITELILPDSVTHIDSYAFWYMTSLKKITLPQGLKRLGSGTFANCTALEDITLPISLQELEGAFSDNVSLKKVTVLNENIKMSTFEFSDINPNVLFLCRKGSSTEKSLKARGFKVSYYQNVNKVTVNPSSLTMSIGKTYKVSTSVSPSNAAVKKLSYKTTNGKVAKVDQNGNITALGAGKTYLVVTANNGKEAKCLITVLNPKDPAKVTLNTNKATISIGKGFQAKTTISPTTAVNKTVTWRSSSPTIASVDSKGNVKALKPGYTYIIATTANGKQAKCLVQVVDIKPNKMVMNLSSATLSIGKAFNAKATVYPTNATDKNVMYSSGNTSVLKVDNNGKVTAVGSGSAYVYAKTSNGITGKILVKVLPNPTSVAITPKSATVKIGAVFKSRGIVTPSNATSSVTFRSSSPSIASVDASGNVKALKEGYTYISVTTVNGKTAKFLLHVVK